MNTKYAKRRLQEVAWLTVYGYLVDAGAPYIYHIVIFFEGQF